MKQKLVCILLLLFVLCSCQNNEAVPQNEPTVQTLNEKFNRRMSSYHDQCKWARLDAFCDDVFENAEKPIEHVYRALQRVAFDVVEEDGFAKGGIYNYDIYFYEDGTAEMVYRHGLEDGSSRSYVFDKNVRFEMNTDEINTLKSVFEEYDFESIPTWNPEEPSGLDGETTYIYGRRGVSGHLATRWSAPEDDAVYKIRSVMEQIVSTHI